MHASQQNPPYGTILVTGATGYVGGRLVPRLLEAGYRVRAMARRLDKIACRPWARHPGVELAEADVLDEARLKAAAKGCDVIYYLVHGMIAQKGRFIDADRISARNMARAAAEGGAKRIVYLGGLGDMDDPSISKHLKSRHEVGEILKSGPVPVTVLNAAMILGSGSASFEILRYLVERLPVMTTPRWVRMPSQPIAVTNVLGYLTGCLEHPETAGETFDIGGPDVLTYQDLIRIYAEVAGLPKRRVIPVPVLSPHLSALWIHLVTPVPSSIAVPLTEGLSVPTVCRENRIQSIVPQRLIPCREAIATALERIRQERVETCWLDAGALHPPEWAHCGDAEWAGGTILQCGYTVTVKAAPGEVWPFVAGIGGKNGYYFGGWLWRLRGWMDRWVGGVGLRSGRRHPVEIRTGDAIDFWRVLEVMPDERLMLLAEMKVPGEAILDILLEPAGEGKTRVRLLSRFLPKGVLGIAYWYALFPMHELVFSGMLKGLSRKTGKAVLEGPKRFTPALGGSCTLPPGSR